MSGERRRGGDGDGDGSPSPSRPAALQDGAPQVFNSAQRQKTEAFVRPTSQLSPRESVQRERKKKV